MRFLLFGLAAGLLACQPGKSPAVAPAAPPFAWQAEVLRAHPLVGRIFDRHAGSYVDPAHVAQRATSSYFVLLGEKHDNPDHHRMQARVLQDMIDAGRRPVVAFEMLDRGLQEQVNHVLLAHPSEPDLLAKAVDWDNSGWPDWELYRPIFVAASRARLPILAANMATVQVRLAVKHGAGAFSPHELRAWGLDRDLPPAQLSAIERDLATSHCGMVPDSIVKAMVLGQRARDAVMADRLLQADGPQGAVLLAGAEHTRRDRGVPAYLEARSPGASILSITWVEVAPGAEAPQGYDEAADIVWFTPRVDAEDPCRKFRHRFR